MIKKEEKKMMRTPTQNPIDKSSTKEIIPQSSVVKKTNKPEQATNLQTANITKSKLINGGGKITTIKTSSSTIKKEVSLQPENLVDEIFTVNIKLESANDLKNKIKEIEDIQKLNANKINLTLSTVFNNDSELSTFTQSLEKVMRNVRNLKWVIKGRLKDSGQCWLIGKVLKKCKCLYSLNLELNFPFLDQSASILAQSIQKHNDLRILKLKILDNDLFTEKQSYFTLTGNKQIINSISQLKNLQIEEYNGRDVYGGRGDYLVFEIGLGYDEFEFEQDPTIEKRDNRKILAEELLRRENKITNLKLVNFYISFKELNYGEKSGLRMEYGEQRISIVEFQEVIQTMIQLVFALPYLTSFKISYSTESDQDEYPEVYPDKKQTKQQLTLQEFIQQRLITVTKFVLLAKHAFQIIPLNPNVLFFDLYYN